MAGSVNKVILIGNLGRDPEVRTFGNGGKVCNLRIATSESWQDRQTGERKEKTEWHNIVIRNENIGRVATQYLRKGSTVYIEGQLQTRKWTDQQGAEKYTTEIVLQRYRGEMTFIGGRSDSGQPPADDSMGGGFGGGGGGNNPYGSGYNSRSDVNSIARAQLVALKGTVSAAAASTSDKMTKMHLADLAQTIKLALDPK